MKRKRRIDPARRSASLEQDGRWRRLEDRVAALENIAGFLFAQMSDDQKRLVESDWNDCEIEAIDLYPQPLSATE